THPKKQNLVVYTEELTHLYEWVSPVTQETDVCDYASFRLARLLACAGYCSYVWRLLSRLSGTSAPIREKHWHYSHYEAGSLSGRWTHDDPRSASQRSACR